MLLDRGIFVDLEDVRALEALKAPIQRPPDSIYVRWTSAIDELEALLTSPEETPDLISRIEALARTIIDLTAEDADIGLFMAMRQDQARHLRYGFSHPVYTALLCILMAQRIGWTERRVLQCIRDPETNVVVIREAEGLAGFAIMKYNETDAHIVLLAVDARRRRSHLGSRLLGWLEATAACAGLRIIRLEARAGNAAARAFYRRHGFEEDGLRDRYYEGVEDAVRVFKTLGRLTPSAGSPPGFDADR
jgi:ribosomal-protein-alanine N-acetyltransferase